MRDSEAHASVSPPQPHIIEGTQILVAPALTTGPRRIVVDWRGTASSTQSPPHGTNLAKISVTYMAC